MRTKVLFTPILRFRLLCVCMIIFFNKAQEWIDCDLLASCFEFDGKKKNFYLFIFGWLSSALPSWLLQG